MWALFPGYCTCATDAAVAFGGMARALGAVITAQPEVRLHALQGLTLLVLAQRAHKQPTVLPSGQVTISLTALTLTLTTDPRTNPTPTPTPTPTLTLTPHPAQVTMSLTAEAEAALSVIGSYAKNFMPLLFNTHQACNHRVLEAVTV